MLSKKNSLFLGGFKGRHCVIKGTGGEFVSTLVLARKDIFLVMACETILVLSCFIQHPLT